MIHDDDDQGHEADGEDVVGAASAAAGVEPDAVVVLAHDEAKRSQMLQPARWGSALSCCGDDGVEVLHCWRKGSGAQFQRGDGHCYRRD